MQHLRYMSRARPIADEIAQTTDPQRRRRLELVLAAREFAGANGLDPRGSYLKVSDTSGLQVGFVVTAAHQDKLEPYEWSYPVVGAIPYRGYFDRAEADGFAEKMLKDGYDTYLFEAAGYSTLGWFDDPLPSGLLFYDDVELVNVVIHELVHQNVYVKDQIAFNETLATAIANELTIDFFRERGETELADIAERRNDRWHGESQIYDRYAERLRAYLDAVKNESRPVLLAGRAQIYAELGAELAGLSEPGAKSEMGEGVAVNNAVFLALWRYRKQADVIGAYLDGFSSMRDAVEDLKRRTENAEDPYDSLKSLPGQAANAAARSRS